MESPTHITQAPAPGVVLARGVCRCLIGHGVSPLTEMALPDRLRMDVTGLARDGMVWGVEVKSSRADFLSDAKWPGYRAWCDLFFFAVPEGFAEALLPVDAGLIRVDAHGGEVLRLPQAHKLPAARRRAVTLRFARLAAERLTARETRAIG